MVVDNLFNLEHNIQGRGYLYVDTANISTIEEFYQKYKAGIYRMLPADVSTLNIPAYNHGTLIVYKIPYGNTGIVLYYIPDNNRPLIFSTYNVKNFGTITFEDLKSRWLQL